MEDVDVRSAITRPYTHPRTTVLGAIYVLCIYLLTYHLLPDYTTALIVFITASIPLFGFLAHTGNDIGIPSWNIQMIHQGGKAAVLTLLHALPIVPLVLAMQQSKPGTITDIILATVLACTILLFTYILPVIIVTSNNDWIPHYKIVFAKGYLTALLYGFAYALVNALANYLVILVTYELLLPWLLMLATTTFTTAVTTFDLVGQSKEQHF